MILFTSSCLKKNERSPDASRLTASGANETRKKVNKNKSPGQLKENQPINLYVSRHVIHAWNLAYITNIPQK